jgi:hypothetical protein
MQSIQGPHSHKNLKKQIAVCSKEQELPCGIMDQEQSKDLSSNAKHSGSTFPQKPQEANCSVQVKNKESSLPFLLYLQVNFAVV